MWPKRKDTLQRLETGLTEFSANRRTLPGIADQTTKTILAMQMVASIRRLDYTEKIRNRPISAERTDPYSPIFDPERAAIFHARQGRLDEAFWLIFLVTHFGKHRTHGWQRLREIYSGLGAGIWSWERTSADPAEFRAWLRENSHRVGGGFGNHRKRESLSSDSPMGTGAVVQSYIDWIGPKRSHNQLVQDLVRDGGNHPHDIFDHFYNCMNVMRFGRLGKFDYLTLVGRLKLAPIAPGSAYLNGATGPLKGARLLFGDNQTSQYNKEQLEDWLRQLDCILNVGMQVLEDSLCNWQKSPRKFVHFRG